MAAIRGSSAASLASAAARFDPVLDAAGERAGAFGAQLFAVVDALDGSGSLRRALTDPSRAGEDKAALVRALLVGKADDAVVDLVGGMVRDRWSADGDLADALERLAVVATLAGAGTDPASGVAAIEDELFRVDRLLVGQRELRRALADTRVPAERRAELVDELFGERVGPTTRTLLRRMTLAPRGRGVAATLSMLGAIAAERRHRLVAAVSAGAMLSREQLDRLGALLEGAYGRPVQLNVSIDPDLLGGVKVQVGSQVVDGTITARLEEARRRVAGTPARTVAAGRPRQETTHG